MLKNQIQSTNIIKSIKIHLLVIVIFIILTSALTFPVILKFTTSFAGIGGDSWAYIWSFWWMDKSVSGGLDPFTSKYMFYPIGIDFTQLSPFNSWVAFLLSPIFNQITIWNILWFSGFIFGGYGTFLLANHFSKKFLPSLISGAIFSFSSYHTAHALGHLELMTISWIPFFILFLFRIAEDNSRVSPVLAGIFFFLVTMSSWYYSFFMLIFSAIYFIVTSLRLKNIKFTSFLIRFLLIFVTATLLSLPLLIPIFHSIHTNPSFVRPISEFYNNSLNVNNLFIPSSIQTITSLFHLPFYVGDIEQISYLGITTLALSTIGIIRYRNNNMLFWLLIAIIFSVLSFGPELKIFGRPSGIPLPEQALYAIPGWSFFRDPTRFTVITSLATAILASFTITSIITRFSSCKKKMMFGGIILFLVLLEFAVVPYPTTIEPFSPGYQLIKEDHINKAVIEAPIGGSGEVGLLSDPVFQYYQTTYEKPMYGGYLARVPIETQRYVQTYFLNQFVWYDEQNDIVKQDLKDVGVSIFNYYNIGYVVVHKKTSWNWIQDHITNHFIPDITKKMAFILQDNPLYEDSDLIIYKIPNNNSKSPFIILGNGWHRLDNINNNLVRTTSPSSEIIVVNPSPDSVKVELEMSLRSIENSHNITILLNNAMLKKVEITTENIQILTDTIRINPGSNTIKIIADGSVLESPQSEYEKPDKISLEFHSISMKKA